MGEHYAKITMTNSQVLSAFQTLQSIVVLANWGNRPPSLSQWLSQCVHVNQPFPFIRTFQGLDSLTWSQWDMERSLLESPLKSPQATQLVSRKAKVCLKQSNYRTHGGGDVSRKRSEKEQGYEMAWWELPNTQFFLGPSLALPLNHLMSHLCGSCDFSWASKLCHLGKMIVFVVYL